ncbi:WD40 repeat-like protein [Nemania abortiva]|nr:WD40 repeat-like protein [Nemania abortiva]
MARPVRRELIDLTSEDTDAVLNHTSFPFRHVLLPNPVVGAVPSHTSPPSPTPHIFPPPFAAVSSPSIEPPVRTPRSTHNGLSTPSVQDMERREGHLRPVKRQRTGEPSPESNVAGHAYKRSPEDVVVALKRCLEAQVFPHIERATQNLSAGIYDLDALGAKVIKTIVDKDFEHRFRQGGGRLSSSAELTIAAGVHRLVTELSCRPDYRIASQNSTPAPPHTTTVLTANIGASVTVPAVLPSIERDAGDHSDEDDDEDDEDEEQDEEGVGYDMEDEEDELEDAFGFDDEAEEEEEDDDDDPSPRPVIPVPRIRIRTPPRRKPPKRPGKARGPVSPQQLRTRAKANQWQSGKPYNSNPVSETTHHPSFGLPLRPYASALERQRVQSGVRRALLPLTASPSQLFHIDFSDTEIRYLQYAARKAYGKPAVDGERSTIRDLRNILKKVPTIKETLAELHAKGYVGCEPPPLSLMKRSTSGVTNFLNDLHSKKLNAEPKCLYIEYSNSIAQSEASRASRIPRLLLSREIIGNRLGAARTYQNFVSTVKSNREDYLEPQVEWTNCAGDIMTISWLSNTDFICGTTTHSDSHNQQYNKPGNLLLGSAATTTLRAYPDHRIVRPVVSSGDNALDSMVASQDPWLFTSVVSSDYDPSCDLAFTSSFDKTVKVWKCQDGSITCLGTWDHEGRVNFVVTSKNGSGTVATAADVPTEAVRVYHLDRSNISGSQYDSYSCTRIHDEDYVPSEKWAYYPAAIRWGLEKDTKHLLLIGYSPRSPTGEDHEIPEDKLNTGELCLWDTKTKTQVKVNSAKTQNVFEVAWHPSRASFAAATSASQVLERTDQTPRTQVRIFEINADGQYGAVKSLDCAAIDINELAIMPNSLAYYYVAASCTDGNVYVWDTAGSDLPMCVLEHGDPVEELLGDREHEDVGVKFVAWATTADRLYTGSSDGVVKVWNIRHGRSVLVKDLIEVAAPITHGAFSPDFTKLVIGDGSGRVYLLALEDPEDEDPPPNPAHISANFLNVQTSSGSRRTIRRPRPFLPHPELPPPGVSTHNELPNKLMEGQECSREYLNTAQLMLHPDPTVGAVQGVNYAATSLFRNEAHLNEDPHEPLLATFQTKQQSYQRSTREEDSRSTCLPQRPKQLDRGLVYINGWQEDWHTHQLDRESINDNDSDQSSDYEDAFDHATLQQLKKEKAELDDRLIELEYETSILDSDDDHDENLEVVDMENEG